MGDWSLSPRHTHWVKRAKAREVGRDWNPKGSDHQIKKWLFGGGAGEVMDTDRYLLILVHFKVAGTAVGEEHPSFRHDPDQGQGGCYGGLARIASGLGLPEGLGPRLPILCEYWSDLGQCMLRADTGMGLISYSVHPGVAC